MQGGVGALQGCNAGGDGVGRDADFFELREELADFGALAGGLCVAGVFEVRLVVLGEVIAQVLAAEVEQGAPDMQWAVGGGEVGVFGHGGEALQATAFAGAHQEGFDIIGLGVGEDDAFEFMSLANFGKPVEALGAGEFFGIVCPPALPSGGDERQVVLLAESLHEVSGLGAPS